MTILVTGGTGYIGLNLCKRLCESGEKVRAILRPRVGHYDKAEALKEMGVETVMMDLRDSGPVHEAMSGVETVYHMAWQSNRLSQAGAGAGPGNAESPAESNLAAMETMIGCARSSGSVTRFIFTGSISSYGPPTDWGPLPRKEADIRSDLDNHRNPFYSQYGGAKYKAEQMLKSACPPPDYVIIRPSLVYGAKAQFASNFVNQARNGGSAGDPRPSQWIHVDDMVDSLILAATLDAAKQNTYNIAGATAVLSQTIWAEAQRLINGSAGGAQAALDWSPRVPPYDIWAAERDLGFLPKVPLQQGLREMVEAELRG